MTNKEAVSLLKDMTSMCKFKDEYGEFVDTDPYYEALDMAIEALEAQDRQAIIAGSYLLEGEDNVPDTNVGDIIYRQDAIDALRKNVQMEHDENDEQVYYIDADDAIDCIEDLPSAEPEGYIKVPDTGIADLSDGYHTFRQLYYQRMMLFATIVNQNKRLAWKSLRHEDGGLCFGGGWFIVGIDTPEGSYTYHYEDKYFILFDCEELECGKHWDGHTEKDVTRLLSLPSAELTIMKVSKGEQDE